MFFLFNRMIRDWRIKRLDTPNLKHLSETTDLADSHPEIFSKLLPKYRTWREAVEAQK